MPQKSVNTKNTLTTKLSTTARIFIKICFRLPLPLINRTTERTVPTAARITTVYSSISHSENGSREVIRPTVPTKNGYILVLYHSAKPSVFFASRVSISDTANAAAMQYSHFGIFLNTDLIFAILIRLSEPASVQGSYSVEIVGKFFS